MIEGPEARDAADSIRAIFDAVGAGVIDLSPAAESLLLDLLEALEESVAGEIDVRAVFVAVAST